MSPGKLKVVIIYIFLKLQQVAILSTNLYYLCLLHVLTEDNLHWLATILGTLIQLLLGDILSVYHMAATFRLGDMVKTTCWLAEWGRKAI